MILDRIIFGANDEKILCSQDKIILMVSGHISRVIHEIISGHRDGIFSKFYIHISSAIDELFLKHKKAVVSTFLELSMELVQDIIDNDSGLPSNIFELYQFTSLHKVIQFDILAHQFTSKM